MSSEQASRHDAHSLLTAAAGVILGFALNLVTARSLGPAGKGLLDLANASAGLFTLALGFSLNAGLTRHIAASGLAPSGLARRLWVWALVAGVITSAVLLPHPSAAAGLGLLPSGDIKFWGVFIAVSVTLNIAIATLRGIAVGCGRLVAANRLEVGIKALWLGAFLFMLACGGGLYAHDFAAVALFLLAMFALGMGFVQRGPTRPEPDALGAIIRATLPLHGANIFYFLNQRADVFFLQATHGTTEVGLYALAVNLAQTILLLSYALGVPLLPAVAAASDPRQAAEIAAAACRRFVFLSGCASILAGALAIPLLPVIFGRDFAASISPLLILLPGMIAYGLGNILVSYFAGVGRNSINLAVSSLGLVLTVAGNLALTRAYGATGAALASLLAYLGIAVVSLLAFSRRTGLPVRRLIVPDGNTLRSSMRMLAHLRP